MDNVIVIAAAKAGKKTGNGSGARKSRGKRSAREFGSFDAGGSRSCTDEVARDMAASNLVMWANLLAVLTDTMALADLPRTLIHDLLDRLDDANFNTLTEDGYEIAAGFLAIIRERLPCND